MNLQSAKHIALKAITQSDAARNEQLEKDALDAQDIPESFRPIQDLASLFQGLETNKPLKTWYLAALRDLYKRGDPKLYSLSENFLAAFPLSSNVKYTLIRQLFHCSLHSTARLHVAVRLLAPLLKEQHPAKLKKRIDDTLPDVLEHVLSAYTHAYTEETSHHELLYTASTLVAMAPKDVWTTAIYNLISDRYSYQSLCYTKTVAKSFEVLYSLLELEPLTWDSFVKLQGVQLDKHAEAYWNSLVEKYPTIFKSK